MALLILSNIYNKAYAIEERVENLPATTVKQWQSQLNDSVAFITNIKVPSTPAGIEVVLDTVNGQTLQQIISTKRNNLIIDLTNATLQLPESRFIQLNPIAGISEVRAIALTKNRVRVTISGVEGTPTGNVVKNDRGLTIGATPPTPVADTNPPDRVINVIVTAQKQPEKPQDVPISLTTLDRQEIENAKIDSFRDSEF